MSLSITRIWLLFISKSQQPATTQEVWESKSNVHQSCCIPAVTYVSMACLSCLEANTNQKMLLASKETTHYPIPQVYIAILTIKIHFYSSIGITYKLLWLENKTHAVSPSGDFPCHISQQHQSFYLSTLPRKSNLIFFSHTQLPGFLSPFVFTQVFWVADRHIWTEIFSNTFKLQDQKQPQGLSVPSGGCGIAPAVVWP